MVTRKHVWRYSHRRSFCNLPGRWGCRHRLLSESILQFLNLFTVPTRMAAGKNIANPVATILSAAMMFEYAFNLMEEGALISAKRLDASLDANVKVTVDIFHRKNRILPPKWGDWIAEWIVKN